jgi:predicted O-linked N-acetylglucosamine transferase (SPINDLY family)
MGIFDRWRAGKQTVADDNAANRAARLVDDGNALLDAGQVDEAMHRYAAAIGLAPGFARAHLNQGNALMAAGQPQAALHSYATALQHRPGYAAAHYNMGNANAALGRTTEALACYREALRHQPDFVDAEVAQGNVLDTLALLEDAAASYRRALQLQPDYAQVHINLISVLRKLGQFDEAVRHCRIVVAMGPDMAETHHNLGAVLQEQRDWVAAQEAFRRAAALKADFSAAVEGAYMCANHLCDWSQHEADGVTLVGMVNRGLSDIRPLSLMGLQPPDGRAAQLQLRASRRYAQDQLAGLGLGKPVTRAGAAGARRLRIGYLSADFREHAVMHLLHGVLAAHDRAKYAIHGYYYGTRHDAMTDRAREVCEVFEDLASVPDAEAAARIAAAEIDILVDLNGFTGSFRVGIAARRPAPVLASWLGYPGTLGHADLADYIIGDPVITPPEHAADFSETLALMPHCYQPNSRSQTIEPCPSREQAGLPETGLVFCSFNQSYKFNRDSFAVWCRLLAQLPGSVLWLPAMSRAVTDNLLRAAQAHGISPERLVFAPMLPSVEQHLARLQLADLALDTFPYNSHTTGSDALWAGVPLVTRMGDTLASRVAASLVHAVGLPELVTQSWDAYFALAMSLATDAPRLAALRRRLELARTQAPLFDAQGFARNLERLYDRMWAQHLAGTRELIDLRQPAG